MCPFDSVVCKNMTYEEVEVTYLKDFEVREISLITTSLFPFFFCKHWNGFLTEAVVVAI